MVARPDLAGGNAAGRTAVAKAHTHVQRLIHLGQVQPGEKLPPARQLSQDIGVSLPSVLDALKILQDEGAVAVRRGRSAGVEVLPTDSGSLEKKLAWLDQHRHTIVQMATMREMVEPGVARLLAENGIPPKIVRKAKDLLRRAESVDDSDLASVRSLDHEFHLLLAAATGMPLIAASLTEARSWVAPVFALVPWQPARPARSHQEHGEILEAIVDGDADLAARLVTGHMGESLAFVKEVLVDQRRWQETRQRIVSAESSS